MASARISERLGAEVMLQACWETTGRSRAEPCRTPWVLLQGAGKSAHEPPSLEPENKAKAEQTGASPEIRI